MEEKAKEWLTGIVKSKLSRIIQVGEVFTDYFGENLVDVQLPNIEALLHSIYDGVTIGQILPAHRLTISAATSDLRIGTDTLSIVVTREQWLGDKDKLILSEDLTTYYEVATPFIERTIQSYADSVLVPILIRFPKVTVTNEHDKSIEITELYAKVVVKHTGTLLEEFSLYRAEYTLAQYLSGYAHSHMPGVAREWQWPCLGDGPIRSTQGYLFSNFNLNMWGLFCFELAKYVTVESLGGGPYHHLENVGSVNSGGEVPYPRVSGVTLRSYEIRFFKYYLRTHDIPVAYVDGHYVLGCHPIDFIVNLSKCFIEWYNKSTSRGIIRRNTLDNLFQEGTVKRYILKGKRLFYTRESTVNYEDIQSMQGEELFKFKGAWVRLNFTDLEDVDTGNTIILLKTSLVSYFLAHVLRTINYNYGHEEDINTSEITSDKRHYYI